MVDKKIYKFALVLMMLLVSFLASLEDKEKINCTKDFCYKNGHLIDENNNYIDPVPHAYFN